MPNHIKDLISESEIAALVQRMEFVPKLIRRQQEELIIDQVALPSEWLKEHREAF